MKNCNFIFIHSFTHSSMDHTNWKSILEIIKSPSNHYVSLLSLFLPVPYFYTVFIQIISMQLTKLDITNFNYILKVIQYLPTHKQFPFARYCWKMYFSLIWFYRIEFHHMQEKKSKQPRREQRIPPSKPTLSPIAFSII